MNALRATVEVFCEPRATHPDCEQAFSAVPTQRQSGVLLASNCNRDAANSNLRMAAECNGPRHLEQLYELVGPATLGSHWPARGSGTTVRQDVSRCLAVFANASTQRTSGSLGIRAGGGGVTCPWDGFDFRAFSRSYLGGLGSEIGETEGTGPLATDEGTLLDKIVRGGPGAPLRDVSYVLSRTLEQALAAGGH